LTDVDVPTVPLAVVVGDAVSAAGVMEAEGAELKDDPTTLLATTVNVYGVPLVNPETTQDVLGAATRHVAPPGDAVTVYDVIGEPPLLVGAVNETTADPSWAVAVTAVGAPGTSTGVTELVVAPTDCPAALIASTVKV